MTPGTRSTLKAIHTSDAWLTLSEMPAGANAAALAFMCMGDAPLAERRMTRWGGEPGQKHGRGYEYRLTDPGRVRAAEMHAA